MATIATTAASTTASAYWPTELPRVSPTKRSASLPTARSDLVARLSSHSSPAARRRKPRGGRAFYPAARSVRNPGTCPTCRQPSRWAQWPALKETDPRMHRSRTLLELQRYDRALDAIAARLKAIAAAQADNPQVMEAERVIAEAETVSSEVEKNLRLVNLERNGLREHIAAEEAKLYGGKVKAPKELQNLELEVASLKKRLAELDDVSLSLLLDRDEKQAGLEAARAHRDSVAHETDEAMSGLATERSDLERKDRTLRPKRESVAEQVTAADMDLYVKLRRAKHGVAVAEVKDGVCAVCGIELPRPLQDTAAANVILARCLGCGRILAG